MLRVAVLLITTLTFLGLNGAIFASTINFTEKEFQLTTSRGHRLTEVVTIQNRTQESQEISLVWKGYEISPSHTIDFVDINPTEINLQPFASTQIELDFLPPADIPPADYHGTLVATTKAGKNIANFTFRVLGVSNENIEVTGISDDGSSLFITTANTGDRTLSVNINAHISSIFDIFEAKVQDKIELKAKEKVDLELPHARLWPGSYQADTTLDYGDNSQRVIESFWIQPKLILLGLLILFIAIYAIFHEVRKRNV